MKTENGFYVWNKGEDALLSYHFKAAEFECHCRFSECREQRISKSLVEKLEAIRLEYGKSITITSGFRCGTEQADLRSKGFQTAKGRSTHEDGIAADVSVGWMTQLVPILKKHFVCIGLAPTWAHVDDRSEPHSWTYT